MFVFNAPPNWPQPPVGWVPNSTWRPDPAWGPAPAGWELWVNTKAVARVEKAAAKDLAKAEKVQAKVEKKETKQAAKAEAKEAAAHLEALALEAYGHEVVRGNFGGKEIKIYSKGYIRVASFWVTKDTPYHKLTSIEAENSAQKKSGAGRAAGALLTAGLNLHSSNMRGDQYLTIVAGTEVWVLHSEGVDANSIKAVKQLEAFGNSVL